MKHMKKFNMRNKTFPRQVEYVGGKFGALKADTEWLEKRGFVVGHRYTAMYTGKMFDVMHGMQKLVYIADMAVMDLGGNVQCFAEV